MIGWTLMSRNISVTITTKHFSEHCGRPRRRERIARGAKEEEEEEEEGGRMEDGSRERQQPLLRSINNVHRSFVKFVNRTLHNVVLYWIDYQGQAVSYGALSPGDCLDIDTFVTHPWIFVDQETRDRYTVNQRDVFFPEPWFARYRDLQRSELPQRHERTSVYITLPVYTLRELSLRAIKRRLTHDRQAFQLDIPRSLQYELATMLPRNEDEEEQEHEEEEEEEVGNARSS